MKRAVLKCVVQMVLAVQSRAELEQKGRPKARYTAKVEPESVSDRVTVFTVSSESSPAEKVVDKEEKGFHCLFGHLAEPPRTEWKYFDYERFPGVSIDELFGIRFMNEEEEENSVERRKLTVFARQHVERVGLGSGRTGHPHGSRRPHACARRPSGAPEQNCCRLVLAGQHLLKDAGSNALDHPGA